MAAYWANFLARRFCRRMTSARLSLAPYTVNVTSAADVQKVIEFTTRHNIRLSNQNTGHDYLGRSTAPGAVALWMHNLKFTEYRPENTSSWYSGPALRIGAGVQGYKAQEAAHNSGPGHGIMSGHSPDIGIAGRYTQGGGHGPLASKYGLAAD
jgi:FAD/FMN-containing dehydrogenase